VSTSIFKSHWIFTLYFPPLFFLSLTESSPLSTLPLLDEEICDLKEAKGMKNK
jgi:hypothetical protein